MATETQPLPPHTTGECHRETLLEDQQRSAADMVRDTAKNVPIATTPDDSLASSLDGAFSSLAAHNVLEVPSDQKDNHIKKPSPSPFMPLEVLPMAGLSSQPSRGQDSGLSVHHSKVPDPALEQLKADDASSQLTHGDDGSHLECHSEMPKVFSERQSPAGTSEQLVQGEEGRPPHGSDEDPTAPTDSLKQSEPLRAPSGLGQEEKGSLLLVHHRDTAEVSEEQRETANATCQLGLGEERSAMDCHSHPSLDSPEQPEPASSPKRVTHSGEHGQAYCATVASPEPPGTLLLRPNSPRQPQEADCFSFPSHHLSSAPSAETERVLQATDTDEDAKPGGHKMVEAGEEKREPNGQDHQSPAAEGDLGKVNGLILEEDLLGDSQENGEQLTQCTRHTTSLPALADPLSDVETDCQQRAAGCVTTSQAIPKPSPRTTSDSCSPAHQGLAPLCDGHGREGLAVHESSETGKDNKPQGEVGAQAVLESEKGEQVTGNACQAAGEPDQAASQVLARQSPESETLTRPSDLADPKAPAGAMVLASAEDPLGDRGRADCQDLAAKYPVAATDQAGSQLKPREGLCAEDSAHAEDLVSAVDVVDTSPVSDEPPAARDSGWPANWVGNSTGRLDTPTNETPIEREIRLHLEREELLRQERGLASPRVTQEYVEVRIRPILNQSVASSMLPKEKERQWAGVQMQREIQRECRREEDLVQLGKVRGAYDRGTPQEVQEKKMIFEQHPSLEPLASRKMPSGSTEGTRGPSFAEADSAANMVILDSGALLRSQRSPPVRTPEANPFYYSRAKTPLSLLEQEVQEAQEREQELQRQRYNLYGSAPPCQPATASDQEEKTSTQPERPLYKKLDVTWPPPSPSETSQMNGLHQLERSPRTLRRQKSALIQRWESGTIGNQEMQD